ncbi:MAG: hypothetical protein KGH72_01010 [Candidatus Micrarchaeota archaeon]|nr:hypothetical protein [Candidatus Micrarchaeota archaeon]
MALLVPILIGLISIIVPGLLLALALLRKTDLPMFEIVVIGFLFGMIFPPTLTWLESYLISYVHFFTFSANLYGLNVLILSIIGAALCLWQGIFNISSFTKSTRKGQDISVAMAADYKQRIKNVRETVSNLSIDMGVIKKHEKEEEELVQRHREEMQLLGSAGDEEKRKVQEAHMQQERQLYQEHEAEERMLLRRGGEQPSFRINPIWVLLLILMLVAFSTRIANIGVAPTYFEFDPYFDMISTEYILVHGYQIPTDHSAWPTVVNGTNHVLEPIVPYVEAYWYQISAPPLPSNTVSLSPASQANVFAPSATSINIALLSDVSSFYPPIAAALLVFAVFLFLYHEYGEMPAIVGAILATAMPALITTFIAGEQLVEPWGIMIMFFFYAAFLLAVNNPKEKRFAILAGIAFAANFLGAHYYTVTAGVYAFYIILQGIIDILRKSDTKDFYIMNAIILGIIILIYLPYGPYNSSLTNRVSTILGVPIIIAMPLLALVFVFVAEYIIKQLVRMRTIADAVMYRAAIIALLIVIAVAPLLFTRLGAPFQKYIQLSVHFTTPSSPLFMTVQEYMPTGWNYDFGAAGFGIIGSNIFGVSLLIWSVLIGFTAIELYSIYKRNSKSSILAIAAVIPLAVAGMSEVKYLPHFGVGYVIAICAIIGELLILMKITNVEKHQKFVYGYTAALIPIAVILAVTGVSYLLMLIAGMVIGLILLAIGMLYYFKSENYGLYFSIVFLFVILIITSEFMPATATVLQAAFNPSCSSINNSNNVIGADMFCNQVPKYWLLATAWMRNNVGPFGPRILSWWDYGDWINWYGNSNAALRGDNSVASYDYATAAHIILSAKDGMTASALASFMDASQAKYMLLDDQLVPKWGALDFLGCVNINQTSQSFATQAGKSLNPPQQYLLGTSNCELTHDPVSILVPISPTVTDYCSFSNSSNIAVTGIGILGTTGIPANVSYCVPESFLYNPTTTRLLNTNGTASNAYIVPYYFDGVQAIGGQDYAIFLVIYAPNGPNGTITDAPTSFYNSTFYRGFFLGKLPGFSVAYPSNFTGINFVNGTYKVVILQLNNFSGSLPAVTQKKPWVNNSYVMPG